MLLRTAYDKYQVLDCKNVLIDVHHFTSMINFSEIFSTAHLTVTQFSFIRFAVQVAISQRIMQLCALEIGFSKMVHFYNFKLIKG